MSALAIGRTARGIRRALAALGMLCLSACEPGVMSPRGPTGIAERTIMLDSLVIMLAIVVPTILATLGFAWWFRASNPRARRLPRWAFSGRIELLVWSVPLLTIMLLGGVIWVSTHELDPAQPLPADKPALEIQVVSLDWKWLFIYPAQQLASVNEVVVPAGVPLHFRLTSASVMSAFFVPRLGSMIYTMNGMATQLNLRADQPGSFRGLSSHYNGDGFSDMHFELRAVSADEFTAWTNSARAGDGPVLDIAAYTELARQSIGVKPFTYRQADPDLFDAVLRQSVPPGPGPETRPHPRTKP